jgi:hypothetical protein
MLFYPAALPLSRQTLELRQALRDAKNAGHAYLILDGTFIPIDRVAAGRPFYSGKHRKPGMNLQVIARLGSAPLVSAPMPSSRPGASCACSAAALGAPGSSPRPSTSFRPAKSNDEQRSVPGRTLCTCT